MKEIWHILNICKSRYLQETAINERTIYELSKSKLCYLHKLSQIGAYQSLE